MSIFDEMKAMKDQFSASELKVYEVVMNTPYYVEVETISRIGERAHTSPSAVLRFCHTLGYSGYKEFRYALKEELHKQSSETEGDKTSQYLTAVETLVSQMKGLDMSLIDELHTAMDKASHIYLMGLYHSSLPVRKLKMMLEDQGVATFYATDYLNGLHLINTIKKDDLLIIFSKSGHLEQYATFLDSLPTGFDHIYLITETKKSPLGKKVNHEILLPRLSVANEHYDMCISMELFVSLLMEKYLK
jgi:DNA-binding MurR/RpiR family transcriptional regulator